MLSFVIVAALVGIATLVPWEHASTQSVSASALVGWGYSTPLDVLTNVLLFAPFGITLTRMLEARKQRHTLWIVLGASAVCAYGVEAAQAFMPGRFSSLYDVIANTAGGVTGLVLWRWRLPGRDTLRGAVYLAAIAVAAIPLQRTTALTGWDPGFPLLVGNEATGNRPWRGRVSTICFADRPLSTTERRAVREHGCAAIAAGSLAAAYSFAGASPYPDATEHLPPLEWRNRAASAALGYAEIRDGAWLQTGLPASALTARIARASRFSIVAAIASDAGDQVGPARIVSISADADRRNITLAQDNHDVVVRVRTRLTGGNGSLRQLRLAGVVEAGHWQHIVVTYDGSAICIDVDDSRKCDTLAPGVAAASLAGDRLVGRVGSAAICDWVFYAIVFTPLGFLIRPARCYPTRIRAATMLLLAPIAFDAVLSTVSGRALAPWYIAYGWLFALCGASIEAWPRLPDWIAARADVHRDPERRTIRRRPLRPDAAS